MCSQVSIYTVLAQYIWCELGLSLFSIVSNIASGLFDACCVWRDSCFSQCLLSFPSSAGEGRIWRELRLSPCLFSVCGANLVSHLVFFRFQHHVRDLRNELYGAQASFVIVCFRIQHRLRSPRCQLYLARASFYIWRAPLYTFNISAFFCYAGHPKTKFCFLGDFFDCVGPSSDLSRQVLQRACNFPSQSPNCSG